MSEILIVILLLVLFYFTYKYIVFIFKRLWLFRKLKSLDRKKKIKIIECLLLNFFKIDGSKTYDLIIQKDDTTYIVKFFGSIRKKYIIGFSNSSYVKEHYVALPLPVYKAEPIRITKEYKFNMKKELDLYKMANWHNTDSNYFYGVYLLTPPPLDIKDEKNNIPLDNGDIVNSCYLYAAKAFLRMLEY